MNGAHMIMDLRWHFCSPTFALKFTAPLRGCPKGGWTGTSILQGMVSWPGARVKYFPRTAMVGSARGNRGGVELAERGRDIECLAEKG